MIAKGKALWGLCVFRSGALEHFFLCEGEEEVLRLLRSTGVQGEVNYSNFGLGSSYSGPLEEVCREMTLRVEGKLNK